MSNAACACMRVVYEPVTYPDGSASDRWVCALGCGSEFTRVPAKPTGGAGDTPLAPPRLHDLARRLVCDLANDAACWERLGARVLAIRAVGYAKELADAVDYHPEQPFAGAAAALKAAPLGPRDEAK